MSFCLWLGKPPCQLSERELTSKDESHLTIKLLREKPVFPVPSGIHHTENLSETLDVSGAQFPCLWGGKTHEVVGETSLQSEVLIRNHRQDVTRCAPGPLPFCLDRFQFQVGLDNMVALHYLIVLRYIWNPESQKNTAFQRTPENLTFPQVQGCKNLEKTPPEKFPISLSPIPSLISLQQTGHMLPHM